MLVIGLIREGKIPSDNRVALTPAQCKFLVAHFSDIKIKVQHSENRCFSDQEYIHAGIEDRIQIIFPDDNELLDLDFLLVLLELIMG